MRLSNIYRLAIAADHPDATTLGSRIRELRLAAGLTQAELGAPMTRSFVSAVERGRAVPSLPALMLFSTRVGVSIGQLLEQVEWTWQDTYTWVHAGYHSSPPRDGR